MQDDHDDDVVDGGDNDDDDDHDDFSTSHINWEYLKFIHVLRPYCICCSELPCPFILLHQNQCITTNTQTSCQRTLFSFFEWEWPSTKLL